MKGSRFGSAASHMTCRECGGASHLHYTTQTTCTYLISLSVSSFRIMSDILVIIRPKGSFAEHFSQPFYCAS